MDISVIINQILVLFIIIFIGYIITKNGIITKNISKGLAYLLLEVSLPSLIIIAITSVKVTDKVLSNMTLMTIISFFSYLMVIIFTLIISKIIPLPANKKIVFQFLIIFGNVGYMGYPVIEAIYPGQGIFYGVINNIFFNTLVWTYGIYLFISGKDDKIKLKNLLNNGIIAVIIGFILLLTNIQLGPIKGALQTLGSMTFPLSMIIIGSSLNRVKFTSVIKDKHLYLITMLKLLILPLIGFFILRLFNLPLLISNISIMLLAMPSGAIGVIFAERYDGNYHFASEGVFITTLLSLFTIPFFAWLIR